MKWLKDKPSEKPSGGAALLLAATPEDEARWAAEETERENARRVAEVQALDALLALQGPPWSAEPTMAPLLAFLRSRQKPPSYFLPALADYLEGGAMGPFVYKPKHRRRGKPKAIGNDDKMIVETFRRQRISSRKWAEAIERTCSATGFKRTKVTDVLARHGISSKSGK